MRVDELLNSHYGEFSENEKYVCHYLNSHFEACSNMTIAAFASDCGVSKSLLIRFAKKLGLSGYSELKAMIRMELREKQPKTEGMLQAMADSYYKMMEELTKKDLSGFFGKLYHAKRVFVYGDGGSQARAASEMKRIFLPVKELLCLHGDCYAHTLQSMAGPEDLVIIISLSGESETVVGLAEALRGRHVPSVSITGLKRNSLAAACEENLYVHSMRLPIGSGAEYVNSAPYFILMEYLYLSYQNYMLRKENP